MLRGAWTTGVGTEVAATWLGFTCGGAVAGEFGACGTAVPEGAAGVRVDTTGALGAATAACEPIQVARPTVEMAAAASEPLLHWRRRLN